MKIIISIFCIIWFLSSAVCQERMIYSSDFGGFNSLSVVDQVTLSDNQHLLFINLSNNGFPSEATAVAKTDSNFNIIWSKQILLNGGFNYLSVSNVISLSDSEIFISLFSGFTGNLDHYIVRIDSSGNILKSIKSPQNSQSPHFIQLRSKKSNILAIQAESTSFYLYEFDANLNELNKCALLDNGSTNDSYVNSINRDKKGNVIIAGSVQGRLNGLESVYLSLDSLFDINWSTVIQVDNGGDGEGMFINEFENGYVCYSEIENWSGGALINTNMDLSLIRLDSLGVPQKAVGFAGIGEAFPNGYFQVVNDTIYTMSQRDNNVTPRSFSFATHKIDTSLINCISTNYPLADIVFYVKVKPNESNSDNIYLASNQPSGSLQFNSFISSTNQSNANNCHFTLGETGLVVPTYIERNIYTKGNCSSFSSVSSSIQPLAISDSAISCSLISSIKSVSIKTDETLLEPNPIMTGEELYFNNFIISITIADITGKIVCDKILNSTHLKIDLPSGIYTLKTTHSNSKKEILKLIVCG